MERSQPEPAVVDRPLTNPLPARGRVCVLGHTHNPQSFGRACGGDELSGGVGSSASSGIPPTWRRRSFSESIQERRTVRDVVHIIVIVAKQIRAKISRP
jgi:hypothetical protein